ISAGFHAVKFGDRGGRRGDFHDEGICTRQAMEHVKASKSGNSGRSIALRANFFAITARPQWVLYQYHVDYQPPMEARRLRSALLYHHNDLLGTARSFDGAILFLPHKLPNKVRTVVHSETRHGEKVQIKITLTNELPPSSPVCLQFYNILFRRILRMLDMQQIGRHYYQPKDPLSIPQHRLTIWPGFTTTILQYESSIMLCTDVSHKVLRSETVLDFMVSLRQQCGPQRFPEICAKELIGLVVLTKYNNKTYRIDDIAWDHTPNNTFKRGDTEISFKNYYKTQYTLDITDGNQVLLISHVKRLGPAGPAPPGPAMLVPEFCYLTGQPGPFRSPPYSPHINVFLETVSLIVKLQGLTCDRNDEAQKELTTWGLKFDKELLNLTGRILPAEKMIQGSRSYDYNPWQADWSKEMRGLPVISAPPLENWIICDSEVGLFSPSCSSLRSIDWSVISQVVVVLPSNRKDKYDSVKKYLCVDCPTPSQCVVGRTLSRPAALMTVATKIALQMACKMGGELWSVEIPLKQLMIVGIDCYHDIVAVTGCTCNMLLLVSRWFSRCVLQDKGQEIMDGLKMAIVGALKEYLKFNGVLPSRIIVYRDGVGDGMLQSVVSYEVPQIIESIRSIGQDYMPKLTVVVVKKRVSSRFFAHIDGKVANPPPGTVIDTDVTRPEWYDFYIVSQAVRAGSVSPTHYNVVYDTSGLKPDHLQRLTYKLCHMYYNWQGIIRVPAPCQYAHKLAFLVGQSIHREPSMKLEDYLFYL
uniref:Piwi like RNA-mediated silencing 1 n=1 Tax=Gadus morhua TaxID=8049 RepID=A0A8C5BEE2_GADMO